MTFTGLSTIEIASAIAADKNATDDTISAAFRALGGHARKESAHTLAVLLYALANMPADIAENHRGMVRDLLTISHPDGEERPILVAAVAVLEACKGDDS